MKVSHDLRNSWFSSMILSYSGAQLALPAREAGGEPGMDETAFR
jgi:hypothetical protein